MTKRAVGLFLAGSAVAGAPGAGQTTLGDPEAVYEEAFSVVQTVRELPDGRVLVADPLGQTLVVFDMATGRADTIGRAGQGPREYRQPDAVWPLPEGKSLLVDLGNGRLAELSSDLEFGATRPYAVGEIGPGRELVLAIPQGVDAKGRLYFRSFGAMGGGAMMADSAYILRLDPSTDAVDSVAAFKLTERTRQSSGGPNNQNVQVTPVPLSPADAWGVAADGRVAIVRAGDYHVDWVAPDGTVTSGPAVDFRPVRIGRAEKEEWRDARAESGGGMQLGVTMTNGSMSMSASRGGSSGDDDLDRYPWPDVKPPFYDGRIPVDPSGRAWVRRHVEAGDAPLYDVFRADGHLETSVELPARRRVVGFGNGKLYLVHTDEFGLQYVERYRMPK